MLDAAEVRERDRLHVVAGVDQRQPELDVGAAAPRGSRGSTCRGRRPPSVPSDSRSCPSGETRLPVASSTASGLPLRVVLLAQRAGEVGRAQHPVGDELAAAADELHQHRHVGVAAAVVLEVRRRAVEVEFLQDHVPHRHRQRGVGALRRVQPQVGELRDLGVVGRHGDDLGALVADLGEEVRVGRARLRHVRAPGHDEGRVVPVGRLGHVGLLAPGLRRGRRQVAVPVVEAHAHAADQRQVAAARGVGHHRHRRDRREADDAVGPVLLDRVDVGGGDDLVDFVPGRADEAAHAAHRLVGLGLRGVLDDRRPGLDRARAPGAPRATAAPAGRAPSGT